MNVKRPWIIASATLALGGFVAGAALASDDIELNDPQSVPAVQLVGDDTGDRGSARVDTSPESADSPGSSPFESANSASDSPGDAGYAPAPAPAPAAPAPAAASADSGASPAPAPKPAKRKAPVYSANSADSGASADSAD